MNKKKIVKVIMLVFCIMLVGYVILLIDSGEIDKEDIKSKLAQIGKIKVSYFAGDLPQELILDEVEFSDAAINKIKKFTKNDTDQVYKVYNFSFSKKAKKNIEKFADKYELECNYEDLGVSLSCERDSEDNRDDEELVLTKEEVANAKKIHKNKLKELLQLFNLDKTHSVNDFSVETPFCVSFTDSEGNTRENEPLNVSFVLGVKDNNKPSYLKFDGNTPSLSMTLNKDGKILGVSYEDLNIKKTGKKYKLRSFEEIKSDILKDKNVTVEGGIDAPLKAYVDEVEIVLYKSFNEDERYMMPYYRMRGYNGTDTLDDDIYIFMTAIQDEYIYFGE